MSRTNLWVVLWVACVVAGVRAADPATGPGPDVADTPGAAFARMIDAVTAGDEAAYRRAVLVRSPSGFSEGYARMLLAGKRLEAVLRDRKLVRPGAARQSANEEKQAAAMKNLAWEVQGDVAVPDPPRNLSGTGGRISVERHGGRWVVVLTDPGPPGTPGLAEYAAAWRVGAKVSASTLRAVEAGQFQDAEQVEAFMRAERGRLAGQRQGTD